MAQYRHEWKHMIDLSDRIAIRQRLRAVARPDGHARDGRYLIRSLYFDTPGDTALREKLDGVNRREKFRLRCYNGDPCHTAVACPDCGWLLTRLGSKNESISCPVCGHRMGLTPCGHWD